MADVTTLLSQPGYSGTGNDDTLFLRIFSGEVLTQFHQLNKMMGLHRVRTLTDAKSALFPVIGTASANYHVKGESIFGTDNGGATSDYLSEIGHREEEIWVDDTMQSSVFIGDIDVLKLHYEARQHYANEVATALADKADGNICRTLFAAAQSTARFNSIPGTLTSAGSAITKRNDKYADATVGANVAAFAFETAELFDQYNIPKDNRILLVRPKQYYALAAEKDLVNRDWTSPNGDYAQAQVLKVAGFRIVMTNSLPSADEATAGAATGERNHPFNYANHQGTGHAKGYLASVEAANLGALAFHPSAIGTVKMRELSSEMKYFMERQGYLLLAKYMMGHNILRPECAAVMLSTNIGV